MRVCVLGLGYVGSVESACLAGDGHTVTGVDIDEVKVRLVNAGRAPVREPGLDELIGRTIEAGTLRATLDAPDALATAAVAMVCAGTPTDLHGNVDLSHVEKCCAEIGSALAAREDFPVVLVRSTIPPGRTRSTLIPILETTSGKQAGRDFGVCVMPEFIREGSALADHHAPMKLAIGADDDRTSAIVLDLYSHLHGNTVITTIEVAELVKYSENAWHALKVGFANEVGALCKRLGVDSHEVMRLFLMDTRLNVSPAYLKPGFAFGGSCLPKDLRALTREGRMLSLELPILNAVLRSNAHHIARTLHLIESMERRRIGVLGITYKPGTDDLRESAVVELVERLIGKGYEVSLYDPNVHLGQLTGANRQQLLQRIPHIAKLLVGDPGQVVNDAQLVIIGTREPEFDRILPFLREDHVVLDLVRIPGLEQTEARYVGLCW